MKLETFNENNSATYCPEDNKLRLYVGRVPHDEYLALRKEGWVTTSKQGCDFAAVWTTSREDTALSYAGIISDEDQSPVDRAADRAERFAGYREKRLGEAVIYADRSFLYRYNHFTFLPSHPIKTNMCLIIYKPTPRKIPSNILKAGENSVGLPQQQKILQQTNEH